MCEFNKNTLNFSSNSLLFIFLIRAHNYHEYTTQTHQLFPLRIMWLYMKSNMLKKLILLLGRSLNLSFTQVDIGHLMEIINELLQIYLDL